MRSSGCDLLGTFGGVLEPKKGGRSTTQDRALPAPLYARRCGKGTCGTAVARRRKRGHRTIRVRGSVRGRGRVPSRPVRARRNVRPLRDDPAALLPAASQTTARSGGRCRASAAAGAAQQAPVLAGWGWPSAQIPALLRGGTLFANARPRTGTPARPAVRAGRRRQRGRARRRAARAPRPTASRAARRRRAAGTGRRVPSPVLAVPAIAARAGRACRLWVLTLRARGRRAGMLDLKHKRCRAPGCARQPYAPQPSVRALHELFRRARCGTMV